MEIKGGKIKWINIVKPAGEDLEWLQKKFGLHPIVIDELKNHSIHGRVEYSDNYLYLIYHFPIYDPAEKISRRAEIDFIITKKDLVTVRYDSENVFADFKKELDPSMRLGVGKRIFPETTLELAHRLLAHLINFNQRQLNHIQEKTEAIGSELFKGKENELLKKISYVKRDLSEYQLIAKPQQHLFSSFIQRGESFWGPQSKIYTEDLLGKYLKLLARLDYHREAILDFEATNNQLLNARTTNVMKMFTILAFLTFPLVLVAALFAMRVGGVPLANDPNGFWLIAGAMTAAVLTMLVFFKNKRWL